MQLQIREKEDALFVKVNGELDLKIADELRRELDNNLDKTNKNNLILDFSGVDFIDSSGLGVILGRYKKLANRGGKIIITNPNSSVKRVLELSGISNIITIDESRKYIG